MKFSAVFSVFVAALSVGVGASPIPLDQTDAIAVSDDSSVTPETPTIETDTYKAVAKIGKNLQPNKYYAFYITNTLKSPPVKEEAPHVNEARKQLGYQHIYYAVGKVTKTTKGGKKHPKEELNFSESMQWDLGFKKGNDHPITYSYTKWTPATDKRSVHFVGEVSEKTVKKLGDVFKEYVKDHPHYNAATNNCNTYVHGLDSRVSLKKVTI